MLADEIAQLLRESGLFEEPVFVNRLPATPDAAIGVFQDGGRASEIPGHTSPEIRVLVRGTTKTDSGYASAMDVYGLVHRKGNGPLVSGGEWVSRIDAAGPPGRYENDENGRIIYEITFDATVSTGA